RSRPSNAATSSKRLLSPKASTTAVTGRLRGRGNRAFLSFPSATAQQADRVHHVRQDNANECDTLPRERATSRAAHLAELSSDVKSPTGPRCASLSGLTIALMPVI